MRAPDTNVLARFFVDDADDAQAARQRPAAIAALAERSFVSVTVLLELEWVLRGFYELPTRDISRVLRALASLEHVTLEDRDAVLVAVDALDKGLEFADALHLARSSRASRFATFDQRLAKRASGLTLAPPVELPVRSDWNLSQNPRPSGNPRQAHGRDRCLGLHAFLTDPHVPVDTNHRERPCARSPRRCATHFAPLSPLPFLRRVPHPPSPTIRRMTHAGQGTAYRTRHALPAR